MKSVSSICCLKILSRWLLLGSIFIGFLATAQIPVVGKGTKSSGGAKKSGREAAQEYFKSDAEKNESSPNHGSKTVTNSDHYLAMHFGNHIQGDAWSWGQKEKQRKTGGASFGITYRYEEWGQSDLNIRIDYNEYSVLNDKPQKLSFMPVIIFPEASSKFPLYFGAGAGLGVFLKQIPDESNISFDYQLFMGARFFNVYGSTGFFIETGIKNHLHLTSDGQFNGTYLALGAVFTF